MAKFCAMPGMCFCLAADLSSTAGTILIDNEAKIKEALAPDKFTYMAVTNGVSCEYVKISCSNGELILDDRAIDWTTAANWNKGDKISFEWISAAWDAYTECKAEEASEEETAPIKIPGFTAEWDAELQQWCYEADEGTESCTWSSGKYRYTFKDGKITKEARPANELPRPGCFENAKVTVDQDSCEIVAVEQGNKVLGSTISSSCKCGKGGITEYEETATQYIMTIQLPDGTTRVLTIDK